MRPNTSRVISRRQALKIGGGAAAATLFAPNILRAEANTIKIGHQQDITGFLSFYGYAFDLGAQGAVKKINAEGGIAGRKLEYVVADTTSDVAVGIRQFRKLVESDGCDFVLGATHSGINLATNPIAKELNTIHFPQGEASQTTGAKGNDLVRRIRSHSAIQGKACVDFALKNLGKKWTFVLTDYAYGHSFYDELVPLLEAGGGQVLSKIAVPVQTQDMIPYLAGINQDTEVLFSVFTTADGLRYLRQIHELGMSAKMARIGPWGMIDGVSLAGIEDALEGAYFLSHSPRWLDQVPAETRANVKSARDVIGVGEDGQVKGTDRIIATSYYLAPWHALHLLKHTVETSGWRSKDDNPALLDAIAKFQGSASPDFPMSDFVMGEGGRQAYQNLWIEQVQGGKLVVQAEVDKEKLI